jgi:6-pyruvoyltetrahydropterin/6-carboxytetrahydropterin synthase
MNVHLCKEFRFEASHQLPNHDGKCARLHGHSWVLKVWVYGPVQEEEGPKQGMVMDYVDIKAVVQPIVDSLDHHHLGHGDRGLADAHLLTRSFPLVPTSENILIWIAGQLVKNAPNFNWTCLALNETCTSEARLYASDYAQEHLIMQGGQQ